MDTLGRFYIGRAYDLKRRKVLETPTLYDPDDLTTHGVVVGMTGSGKTGLCVDILEEAALNGIPALLIDPKGDIANLLLHFPELKAEDFEPWVDPDEARREGKERDQLAAEMAALWRKGLAEWGMNEERILRVRQAAEYAVYTPGSDAGLPVSILASLQAPSIPWEENRESLREEISSIVTALLGLVGVETDPIRSREHILLSNLLEDAWRQGLDLNLVELIRQIQNPPLEKLGAFELGEFFPAEDRTELAMRLNNLLASPTFQAWVEGTPLDIDAFLWAPDGRPRQSVFYLSHLPDGERMFFVTLLLTAVEAWMRAQPGSGSLRALLYFDEVLGFLPPVAKPPSKPPLLRLLKQARAYGLGVLLTTQNPVDLDYKGLSNAGTWFVGKLQTEQDKERLLDGLEGVEAGAGGFNRAWADKAISALGKRIFYLHNVHEEAPQIFHTRWAMAYLKGPITRDQVRALNALSGTGVGVDLEPAPAAVEGPSSVTGLEAFSSTRPAPPSGLDEAFLANNLTVAESLKQESRSSSGVERIGLVYRPALLAQASARYLRRNLNLDHLATFTALVMDPEPRGVVRWEQALTTVIPEDSLEAEPIDEARFSNLEAPLSDGKTLRALRKDFSDYLYHNAELRLLSNPSLDLVAQPGTTREAFAEQCERAARAAREQEAEELKRKYQKKIKKIEIRLTREERELAEDQAELSGRKMEELATHAENLLGIFSGSRSRRRVSSSLTKRRLTSKAKAEVEESLEEIEELRAELEEMEGELIEELEELDDRWEQIEAEVEQTVVTPYKKDIHLDFFGVAWVPYWLLRGEEGLFESPGYGG